MRTVFVTAVSALAVLAIPATAAVNTIADKQQAAKLAADQPGEFENSYRAWSKIIAAWKEGPAAYDVAPASYVTPKVARSASLSGSDAIAFTSKPVVQDVPLARTGYYPVCRNDSDDSCINGWEAGHRGPGVNVPLAYYPGRQSDS